MPEENTRTIGLKQAIVLEPRESAQPRMSVSLVRFGGRIVAILCRNLDSEEYFPYTVGSLAGYRRGAVGVEITLDDVVGYARGFVSSGTTHRKAAMTAVWEVLGTKIINIRALRSQIEAALPALRDEQVAEKVREYLKNPLPKGKLRNPDFLAIRDITVEVVEGILAVM